MIKKVFMMIVAAALMALPAVAQNYATPYKPTSNRNGMQQMEATTPSSSFQSTSAMSGSGSQYSANPMLSSDGTATYNGASASSGPHRAKKDEGVGAIDPDTHDEKPFNPPVGDPVLPLLLMSLAFCGYLYLRRKKAVKS